MDLKRLAAYYDQVDHPETHRSILSWLMIVENIISFVCGLPWGKTEFWIMLENFGFEWIFLEPTRWKWLNMEIFKLSFSNWLLPDKELRGNIEIEGENDQRISALEGIGWNLVGLHQMDLVLTMDYILTRSICCGGSIMATRPIWWEGDS